MLAQQQALVAEQTAANIVGIQRQEVEAIAPVAVAFAA